MTIPSTAGWDHTVDVLVVGSGVGGMVAALQAHERGGRVLVIEKSATYGGSSARSGGGLWIPNNHLMPAAGVADSAVDALAYLRATTRNVVAPDRLRALVDGGPEMLRFLWDRTCARFDVLEEYPDYYPDVAGWRPGGRSLEPRSFDARLLGAEFLKMRPPATQVLIQGRIMMTVKQARQLLCRGPGWGRLLAEMFARYWSDLPWRLRSSRDRNLTMGNALVGMLRRSLMDRGIPLWLNAPARELIVASGRIAGALAACEGRRVRIRAAKGVILASGGFESSQSLRERYLPNPTRAEWTCGSPDNTGDAIGLGCSVGAALDLMDYACWGPTTVVPGEDRARVLVIEKSLPGSILVNRLGERFVNEASPYVDVVNAMYRTQRSGAPCVPAYLVFDAEFRKRYPCGPLLPGSQQPDWSAPRQWMRTYLRKADCLEDLAARLGVDREGLCNTVAAFNRAAREGRDPDFHRGESVFDRYYGDAKVQPNPCLAPLLKPPFYGIEVYAGDFGTMGGLRADAHARVISEGGEVIPGLYAVGNCAASPVGRTYPGAGSTLGPAATFGYLAAKHAMGG